MRAIFVHRQQIPRIAVQILVEILDQGRREILLRIWPLSHQTRPWTLAKSWGLARAQDVEQFLHRDRALAVADEIDRGFAQRALGKSGGVATDDDDALIGIARLDRETGRGRRRHLLGRGRRLMAEYDHTDQAGIACRDLIRHRIDAKLIRFGIDDLTP